MEKLMRNIFVEMDIVQNEYPTTFTVLSLNEQTEDTAQYVARRFVSDLPENLSVAEMEKHINENVTKANSYLFDAMYSDANKLSFCENCAYEWANLFWGQLFTYNAILQRFGCEDLRILKVSKNKSATHFFTESGVAEFVYDTTLQSVPINETEKRIEEIFYSDLEMEAV